MKLKQQKRREACDRIKSGLPAAEQAIVKAYGELSKPIDRHEIAFYGSADAAKQSRTKAYEQAVNTRNRMQRDIAHLESL